MKYIFIKPPEPYIENIILPGIPSLMGILEHIGIESEYINLNFAYEKYYTQFSNLENYNRKLKNYYNNEQINNIPTLFLDIYKQQKIAFSQYLNCFNNTLSKKVKLEKCNSNYGSICRYIQENNLIFKYSNIYKSDTALFSINIQDVIYLYKSSANVLSEFLENEIEKILKKQPNIIGIQILSSVNLVSALFIGYMIKEKHKNIHINIGGNYFERNYKNISNLKDLFGTFFDSISIGDSTNTVIELTKHINSEISIEQVSNLMYLKNNEIKINNQSKTKYMNNIPYQSFEGYNKEDYILNELVLPVRATKTNSCYWGKCIYCTCSDTNETYSIMNEERFIDEIEYLSKKYNTKYFAFWDNSIHPRYIEKVADLIIKKKLDIKYNFYARLEPEFTYKLLKKIKKSGCIAIHWGLDSASQRICNFINKGINIEKTQKILEYSHKAGLYNFVYLIFGCPTETIQDIEENYKFIKKNKKVIDDISCFEDILFLEGALLKTNIEYYQNLINLNPEYIKKKKIIINDIENIIKPGKFMLQYVYIYISKYGKLRFKFLQRLSYYYLHTLNKPKSKFINRIYNYLLNKCVNC